MHSSWDSYSKRASAGTLKARLLTTLLAIGASCSPPLGGGRLVHTCVIIIGTAKMDHHYAPISPWDQRDPLKGLPGTRPIKQGLHKQHTRTHACVLRSVRSTHSLCVVVLWRTHGALRSAAGRTGRRHARLHLPLPTQLNSAAADSANRCLSRENNKARPDACTPWAHRRARALLHWCGSCSFPRRRRPVIRDITSSRHHGWARQPASSHPLQCNAVTQAAAAAATRPATRLAPSIIRGRASPRAPRT